MKFYNGLLTELCMNGISMNFDDDILVYTNHEAYKFSDMKCIENNLGYTFRKCGMAAYEQRDVMPLYAEFVGNVCENAGEGFSCLGEIMPRNSEIWPQPMGHHIFLWRIKKTTPDGGIKIEKNTFSNAIYGKAVYSIIDESAQKQLIINDNKYTGTFIEE